MRRHAYGLVGFAGATLLSVALVALWAMPVSLSPLAPPARSYHVEGEGLANFGRARSQTVVVRCSDGTRLFLVRTFHATPERARTAYAELLGQLGGTALARSVSVDGQGRARIIFVRDQIADPEQPGTLAYSSYAVAWLDEVYLTKVYGPSPMHVIEYEASLR